MKLPQKTRQHIRRTLAKGVQHLPLWRWRFHMHRHGEERPWQYIVIASDDDLVRFWNAGSSIDLEPVTADDLSDAMHEAYEAGVRAEKFGRHPIDELVFHLGYRPCKRSRAWTIVDCQGAKSRLRGYAAKHLP